jgi:hypothetical protein
MDMKEYERKNGDRWMYVGGKTKKHENKETFLKFVFPVDGEIKRKLGVLPIVL